jgi:hypothetical protein
MTRDIHVTEYYPKKKKKVTSKSNKPVQWNQEREAAFEKVQQIANECPTLTFNFKIYLHRKRATYIQYSIDLSCQLNIGKVLILILLFENFDSLQNVINSDLFSSCSEAKLQTQLLLDKQKTIDF